MNQPDWLVAAARADYADFFRIEEEERNNAIRKATRTGRLFGSDSFVDDLECVLNRRIRTRRAGRPRKQGEDNTK